jgi:hypothetical protein
VGWPIRLVLLSFGNRAFHIPIYKVVDTTDGAGGVIVVWSSGVCARTVVDRVVVVVVVAEGEFTSTATLGASTAPCADPEPVVSKS